MKKILGGIAAASLIMAGSAFAGGHAHWGYTGDVGPSHWGDLDPAFHMCKEGKNQSPIDLKGFIEADLKPIQVSYETHPVEIVNNGHSIQVNVGVGGTLTIDGHTFALKQFHFHAPSENLIEGKSFPMEAHFVHADKAGNLAVIAVMFEIGKKNPVIEELWKNMPDHAGKKVSLAGSTLDPAALLPSDHDYYRFNGSLTTPPCSEGVWWIVMKKTVQVSKEQVEKFEHVMHHPNNRPVQPVNARPVLK